MGVDLKTPQRSGVRTGVGIVELVDEPRADVGLLTLRENLRNRVCALLVALVLAAQVADIVTTVRALSQSQYYETNPLLRSLMVRWPLAAYSVKLLVVAALLLVVLSRMRGRRARLALAVAAAVSLIAPVMNFALLAKG